MATGALQTIRNGVLVIGVSASLAAGSLGFSRRAEARVPEGDRVSFTAQYCGSIQDSFDEAQMKNDFGMVSFWVQIWYAEGCDQHYGPISVRRVPRSSNIVTGVDSVSAGSPTSGSPVTPAGGITRLGVCNQLRHQSPS